MLAKLTIPQVLEEMGASFQFANRISNALKTGVLDLYGKSDSDEASKAWDLITDICEGVRENKWRLLSTEQRIDTLLSVFETFPHYTSSSHLFLTFSQDDDLSGEAKEKLWDGIIRQLTIKNENIREPMEYVLWVDFFEDQNTCEESWLALTSRASASFALDRLLIIAGPVPYKLKQPFYERCADDRSRHAILAQSLAHSVNDVYGKIDKTDAKKYLRILELPHENEYFSFLRERL